VAASSGGATGWQAPANPAGVPGPGQPGKAGSLAVLELVAALVVVATLFMPWLTWRFSFGGQFYPDGMMDGIVMSVSLWDLLGESGTPGWMYLVAAGAGLAALAAFVELVGRPQGKMARLGALGGFGAVLLGIAIGLTSPGNVLGLDKSLLSELGIHQDYDIGLWLALGAAAAGAMLAGVHSVVPPSPARPPAWSSYAPPYPSAPPPQPGWWPPAQPPWGAPPPPAWGPPPSPGWGWPAAAPPAPAAPTPAMGSDGLVIVNEPGGTSTVTLRPGEEAAVGHDPDCRIRLADPRVSGRHAVIEWRGQEWVVRALETASPPQLIDPSGVAAPLRGEVALPSGQIAVGDALLTLMPWQP
jgi:hypothetical protein